MTSKKELEDECNKKIQELEKQLPALEEQHKAFLSEDKEEDDRVYEERRLSLQLERLENQVYEGNFGNRDAWYYGRIPEEFKFNENDEEEIKEALKEIGNEKMKEIEESEEYKRISSEREKIIWTKNSPKHYELHKKINDIEDSIKWNERRIKSIQDKGELIKVCKWIAEHKRNEEVRKARKEKIEKYKEMILAKSD